MPTFGFVVLHYLVDDATTQCVESIREHCAGGDYHIVVVDNDSANGSHERLQERYGAPPTSRCCTTPPTKASRAATTPATATAGNSCTATTS